MRRAYAGETADLTLETALNPSPRPDRPSVPTAQSVSLGGCPCQSV